MMRAMAGQAALKLLTFATSNKYPTRTVEHALAWVIIAWSYSVLMHTDMVARLPGDVYGPMLDLMSSRAWGSIGLIIGVSRILALIGNGHWHPSPELRLVGAAWGVMFWAALSYCYFIAVVVNGGPDFPMRRAFLVFIFFEAYSCYRCGQDIGKRNRSLESSEPSRSVGAGNG